jgi:hypothetical protein
MDAHIQAYTHIHPWMEISESKKQEIINSDYWGEEELGSTCGFFFKPITDVASAWQLGEIILIQSVLRFTVKVQSISDLLLLLM